MLLADLNPLAILLAALANMLLGALWYSPLLFATGWMAEVGAPRSRSATARKRRDAGTWPAPPGRW